MTGANQDPHSPHKGRGRRGLTREERQLWAVVAETVTPLADRASHDPTGPAGVELAQPEMSEGQPAPVSPVKPLGKARTKPEAAISRPPGPMTTPSSVFTPPSLSLAPGVTPGLDRRTAERLRRGRLPVEARLDLHGMTQVEAHIALTSFIESAAKRGRRCVLIITGKGLRGEGVLRRSVPHWLNDERLRPYLLAIENAQPEDGGHGALYILLRRHREGA